MRVFARDSEAEAYRVLHTGGFAALEDRYPALAHGLVNQWHDRYLCRATWTSSGELKIRTFKKYANERGAA